jgi:predicted lysophospholipase L1 biosynthesis ABC-type transport system permease subunit
LGAGRRGIVGLVLREIAIVFAVGLGAGVVAALAGRRYLTSQLFGVAPIDPAVFAASTAALLAASMAAALLPAWRATRIDPIRAYATTDGLRTRRVLLGRRSAARRCSARRRTARGTAEPQKSPPRP